MDGDLMTTRLLSSLFQSILRLTALRLSWPAGDVEAAITRYSDLADRTRPSEVMKRDLAAAGFSVVQIRGAAWIGVPVKYARWWLWGRCMAGLLHVSSRPQLKV